MLFGNPKARARARRTVGVPDAAQQWQALTVAWQIRPSGGLLVTAPVTEHLPVTAPHMLVSAFHFLIQVTGTHSGSSLALAQTQA